MVNFVGLASGWTINLDGHDSLAALRRGELDTGVQSEKGNGAGEGTTAGGCREIAIVKLS